MIAIGLLYSKINESQASLYLMWVLQLSKKHIQYQFYKDPLLQKENKLVILELEAQLITEIVVSYAQIGKPDQPN